MLHVPMSQSFQSDYYQYKQYVSDFSKDNYCFIIRITLTENIDKDKIKKPMAE